MDIGSAIPAQAPAWLPHARLHGQMALLERLAEVGMQIAEAMTRQIKAPALAPLAAPAPKLFQGDIVLAYARVSRAVRRTIGLQLKLLKELVEADRFPAAQTAKVAATPKPETDAKEVAESPERPEAVERPERFDREAPDEIDALLRRPTEDVLDIICRDLGVSPAWAAQARAEGWREETELDDFGEPLGAGRPRPARPPERWPRPAPS